MSLAFDDVAGELYGLVPPEFTSTRDTRARQARQAGDPELAAAIKRLKRPTTSAWLVNLLARRRPELVDELLDLGSAMRQAHEQLAGDRLRQLSQQRRQLISALSQAARELAGEVQQSVSEEADRELEVTLDAALADAGAGDAVRSGRLTNGLKPSGLGSSDLAAAAASSAPDTSSSVRTSTTKRVPSSKRSGREPSGLRREAARQALAESETAVTAVRAQIAELADRVNAAQEERRRRRAAVRDLEAQLESVRAEETAVAGQLREAERAHEAAALSAKAAERRADQARQTLSRLGD
ncbi:MAG TPA: hypothetical protein VKA05_03005 [Acidimicrobiales bacterium]|nr:hypothetical protein [Acidimicrobiales bacterium]